MCLLACYWLAAGYWAWSTTNYWYKIFMPNEATWIVGQCRPHTVDNKHNIDLHDFKHTTNIKIS